MYTEFFLTHNIKASLVTQLVKNPPAMWTWTWVQSLGWEDHLEKGKATHSSILAWTIPWTLQSMGSQRVRHNWATFTHSLIIPRRLPFCKCPWSNVTFYLQLFFMVNIPSWRNWVAEKTLCTQLYIIAICTKDARDIADEKNPTAKG